MKLVDIIVGARPNFMKVAPIIRSFEQRNASVMRLSYRLIHTGQHYDARMSTDFFTQLGIPAPHINLGVGSGTQAEQTGAIMAGYERVLHEAASDLCLVVGDVTSTMACAITAKKAHIPVAHVEAGIRSGDWTMPEEINRMVTDSISNWFFTTSEVANTNLRKIGVEDERIHFVGNTMIDTLLSNLSRLKKPAFWDERGLKSGEYFVITLHRPANVDEEKTIIRTLRAIASGTRGLPIVFPVHPRTAKTLRGLTEIPESFIFVEPQSYLEFNYLVKSAKAVITDSGGITEETTVMGVPCITLRDSTERPETVTIGTNELIGTEPANIKPILDKLFTGEWKKGSIPDLWDGRAAERIVVILEGLL